MAATDEYIEGWPTGQYWDVSAADVFEAVAPPELTELIDRLLETRRPRAAFHAVHMDVGGVLEGIAASYECEAGWHDSEARINKRLRY